MSAAAEVYFRSLVFTSQAGIGVTQPVLTYGAILVEKKFTRLDF